MVRTECLSLRSVGTQIMSQPIHHAASPLQRQCPAPPPNTAEYDESSALEVKVDLGDIPRSLPLLSFDDSSQVSSASLLDTQGFALGISDDTQAQSLSLPSEPPDLDLRDWILRRRIEPSQQNYVHIKSGAFSPENLKFGRPSSQNENPSAAHHHQHRDEPTESEGAKRKWRSVFCRKNWDGLTSSIGADSESEQHPHLPSEPTNQIGDLCDGTNCLEGVRGPSCLNNGSPLNEIEALPDRAEQEEDGAPVLIHSRADDESENSVTEDETEITVDENGRGIQDSFVLGFNLMEPAKENSLEVKSAVSLSRTRSSSTHFLRKPLSDTGNLLLGPRQSKHDADKWRCPKIDKKHFKPPPKQLSLDRWLLQPK